jgi:hypothetical protein
MEIEPILLNYPEGTPRSDTRDSLNAIRNTSAHTMAMTTHTTKQRLSEFSFSKPLYKVNGDFLIHKTENIYENLWAFVTVFDSQM